MSDRSDDLDTKGSGEPLYFFPDRRVTDRELRAILEEAPLEARAEAISYLLRYAVWDDIWDYVTREEVREVFHLLDLGEKLRQAYARMLEIEAEVT